MNPTIEEDVKAWYALPYAEFMAYLGRTTFMMGLCRVCHKSDETTAQGARYCIECMQELDRQDREYKA